MPPPAASTLTRAEILERVARDGVRRAATALRKPPVPSRVLQELAELRDPPEARRFVAAYALAPSHLLETIADTTRDPETLSLLATNPRTAPHLLVRFATHEDPRVRAEAASHPQLPPRELRALAADAVPEVRRALAGNPALRLAEQSQLAADADPSVRLCLAAGAPPPELALALGADASGVVRTQTVATAKTEDDLLTGWAASDEAALQLALLRRPDLPEAARRALLLSPHAPVRRAARELGPLDEVEQLFLATRGTAEERRWLAAHKKLARPLQRLLAQDAEPEVRAALAAHPAIAEDIATFFIGNGDPTACAALAANPNLPEGLDEALAATRIPEVLTALAYRPDLNPELARVLLDVSADFRHHWAFQERPIEGLDADLAERLRHDPQPAVRALACRAHAWRGPELYDFARDPAAPVRRAALQHEAAPDGLLEDLARDADPEVAALAHQLQTERTQRRWSTAKPAAGPKAKASAAAARPIPAIATPEVRPQTGARPTANRPAHDPSLLGKLKRLLWS